MKGRIAFLLVALLATPALASIATPYVAGGMNGWDENNDPMTETVAGSGIWTRTYTGLTADTRYEFKITDGTWGTSIPGPNSWLYTDGSGAITITYDGNTYADGWSPTMDRLGLNVDQAAGWTVAGSFQGWNNANPATAMTPVGGGVYSLTYVFATPGTYEFKPVVTGTWDSISWDARSVNTANWSVTTDAVNNTVTFWVNQRAGTVKYDLTPEPSTLALLLIGGLAILRRK